MAVGSTPPATTPQSEAGLEPGLPRAVQAVSGWGDGCISLSLSSMAVSRCLHCILVQEPQSSRLAGLPTSCSTHGSLTCVLCHGRRRRGDGEAGLWDGRAAQDFLVFPEMRLRPHAYRWPAVGLGCNSVSSPSPVSPESCLHITGAAPAHGGHQRGLCSVRHFPCPTVRGLP